MFIIYGRKTYQGCSTKRPIILKVLEESGKVLRSLDQSYQMCLLWTKIRRGKTLQCSQAMRI